MTTILILSIVGIAAIIAELVLPGGILGVAGAICLVAAVIMTFVGYGAFAGMIALIALIILGCATLSLWMKHFHRLPVTRKFILDNASGNTGEQTEQESLVGKTGTTLTDLTPSGHAVIEGTKMGVMTAAASIPKGTEVRVVSVSGIAITVSALDHED